MQQSVNALDDVAKKISQAAAITNNEGTIFSTNKEFDRIFATSISSVDLQPLLIKAQASKTSKVEKRIETTVGSFKVDLISLISDTEEAKWLFIFLPEKKDFIKEKFASLKNLYRSFVGNSFELLFRTSLDDKLIFSNKLFIQSFGFKLYSDVKGNLAASIFEDALIYEQLKNRVLKEGTITHATVFFRGPDGKRLTGLANCQVYSNERGIPLLNWTVLNISDRIEYEDRLKSKSEQLERINLQMEKFLYSTSHDLRSPITSILGLVNLLRMETKDIIVLDYISKIEASAAKLDKTIKDILTYSKTTYQRTKSERIEFEPLVWKVWNHYQENPNLRKINLQVTIKGDSHFFTDAERIEIIIDSILSNSIYFYDANKTRSFVKISIEINDHQARIEFADNGIGIGKAYLENIFTMFYKATHLSKGAGLGLFIVREALNQLNGAIQVQSEIGFGTVFLITLPNDHKGRLINRKLHLLQPQSKLL